jgi:hypothetical protein
MNVGTRFIYFFLILFILYFSVYIAPEVIKNTCDNYYVFIIYFIVEKIIDIQKAVMCGVLE